MTKQLSIPSKILVSTIAVSTLSISLLTMASEASAKTKHYLNHEEVSPRAIAQNQNTSKNLMAVADDGTPETLTKEDWLTATGEVSVLEVNPDSYTVKVEANNLVPDGLYTLWWVNKKLIGMDMGPAGGLNANEFRADGEGNATTTISVPANNNYQMLVAAYHADDLTHGEMPGEMGEVTFGHLKGDFPRPN